MLAYLDSFAGLVPCRILAVGDWADPYSDAKIQVTAARRGYVRGLVITVNLSRVVPRQAVFRRCYQHRIRFYQWPHIVAQQKAGIPIGRGNLAAVVESRPLGDIA